MLLMICFPYVFDRYESEAILNLVLGGKIFLAKVAVTLNRTIGDTFKHLPCLKEGLFLTHHEDISLFFWIDGKVLLISLLTQFHLLDSFVLFICLL